MFGSINHRSNAIITGLFAIAVFSFFFLIPSSAQARVSLTDLQNQINALQALVAQQQNTIDELYEKLQNVHVDGDNLVFEGVNVQIVNGLGPPGGPGENFSPPINGLGNLIVGYNKNDNGYDEAIERKGSHNVIIGDEHRYPSYGGFVAGHNNKASGIYASVSGGSKNVAAAFASISGGEGNTASGFYSSITGGSSNFIPVAGMYSCITGGDNNQTWADHTGISGGRNNKVLASYSQVGGGAEAQLFLPNSWIVGGFLSLEELNYMGQQIENLWNEVYHLDDRIDEVWDYVTDKVIELKNYMDSKFAELWDYLQHGLWDDIADLWPF